MTAETAPTMHLVHAAHGQPNLRERLKPSNWKPETRAKAATGMIWWQHAQSAAGAALIATGSVGLGAAILGLNAVQYPLLYMYRANRRKDAGLPPLEGRIFRRNKEGAHQVHQVVEPTATVPQLPQRQTIFSADKPDAA